MNENKDELKSLSQHIGEVYYEIVCKNEHRTVTKSFVEEIVDKLAERIRNEDNSVKIELNEIKYEENCKIIAKLEVSILDWYEGFPTVVTNFYLELPVLPLMEV